MAEPNAREMDYPMKSEFAKHAHSPAATGGEPPSPPPDQEQPIEPSEEAKHQWAGAKGPAQAGKP